MFHSLGEFTYAVNRKGVEKLIPVVMEPVCRDTTKWQGVVGMRLGSRLYIDLSMDTSSPEFAANMKVLEDAVRSQVEEKKSLKNTSRHCSRDVLSQGTTELSRFTTES